MNNLLFALAFISLFIAGCEKNTGDEPQETSELKLSTAQKVLVSSTNKFGLKLYKEISTQTGAGKNIFISPLSVAYALTMTYNGADGATKEAMENVLETSGLSKEEINTSYHDLMEALVELDEKVLLSIANSIWYRDGFFVEPEFISVNQNYYDAEVSALDFDSPEALNIINDWVAAKTNNKILHILDQIPPEAVMYLVNAIYFKGTWKYEFEEEKTTESPFYLEDGTPVQCSTMVQKSEFYYTRNDLFEAVELPYGEEDYSMVILLPDVSKSVHDIIQVLDDENWDQWMKDFTVKSEVQVYLPRLKVEYEEILNSSLSALGMEIAFTGSADFTGINPEGNIFISMVKHKSFLEVNEEGSEAAAVTVVEISQTSIDPGDSTIHFRVNRPFVLAIRERSSNTLLFMGTINNPRETK